jgi:single-strand DNA-binding protein
MASFNRVILIGNLTRDPELRYIPSGTAVTEIGLAVNDRRKGANGEWIDETTFVDVTLWGRQAEVATEYLSKGSPVFIEGRLKLDSWQDKEGQKRSKLRVVGTQMQMLGSKGQGGGKPAGRGATYDESEYGGPSGDSYSEPSGAGASVQAPDDDIPF